MSFRSDNKDYETWLRNQIQVVEKDLDRKHKRMRKDSFTFLRATYFRWARRIERICPTLAEAPTVLSVGDLHLENFGTWRDAEGRLVWGVNDFDEAALMPYPFDLVRIAASARLAPGVTIDNRVIAAAVLGGYRRGIAEPRPTLLDEQERWMRPFVACSDGERQKFWAEMDGLPDAAPSAKVKRALSASLPKDASIVRFASRRKGGGSLGRPRYVAIAEWRGGRIFREAKALVPSAWSWAHREDAAKSQFLDLATGRFRAPDPFLKVHDEKWIIRRIAADSRKIDLGDTGSGPLMATLFEAMGFDIGAIHVAGVPDRGRIEHDLDSRDPDWLDTTARDATAAVEDDYREWVGRGAF